MRSGEERKQRTKERGRREQTSLLSVEEKRRMSDRVRGSWELLLRAKKGPFCSQSRKKDRKINSSQSKSADGQVANCGGEGDQRAGWWQRICTVRTNDGRKRDTSTVW